MGRIQEAFERAEREQRAALIIYLCAGDPDLATTARLVCAAADAGADIIELGMPFSDPTADGAAIQKASERALAGGTTMRGALDVVATVRKTHDVPVLLFGYYNPVLSYGEVKLANDAADAGADGFLVVDLPPEEAGTLRDAAVARGLDIVPLIAPTSHEARVQLAAQTATSFIYYVSMTGVTGAVGLDLDAASKRAAELSARVGRPLALGFGVSTADDVRGVAKHVPGVVVGSAVVRAIASAATPDDAVTAVSALVSSLAAGTSRS
ncbi:MAG: tryptophan synthase subunit alpha [Sandaracinaceae bacterium]|nr:tryptophan synthase subunit alpha [Sandaracinaceae bacterium]